MNVEMKEGLWPEPTKVVLTKKASADGRNSTRARFLCGWSAELGSEKRQQKKDWGVADCMNAIHTKERLEMLGDERISNKQSPAQEGWFGNEALR